MQPSADTITQYIKSMSPNAELMEKVGLELTFDLPKDESEMKVSFHEFFTQLDSNQKTLGISNYGLSDTTLEEASGLSSLNFVY